MLKEIDPLMLKEIYDPEGTDEGGSVRYVFSEQNNEDKPNGILLGDEQAIDSSISIRNMDNCLMNNSDLTPIPYDTVDLTMQQKNTFNELFEYVRMLEDNGGNINPVFIIDEYEFVKDANKGKLTIVHHSKSNTYKVKYNNITYPVKWLDDSVVSGNYGNKLKSNDFDFEVEYNKNNSVPSIVKVKVNDSLDIRFENVVSNHPNIFKNFFGSSFKRIHVSAMQQEEHMLIGNKRVLAVSDVDKKEYFLKQDMEVTFMPRECDTVKNVVCFTLSFKHNITGKTIHRSIEITEPKFLNSGDTEVNDKTLIESIKETGGLGDIKIEDNRVGESYKYLEEVKDSKNSLIDKKTTAINIKMMNLEFKIKQEKVKEEKAKQKAGREYKVIGPIKTVLTVGEVFGEDQDVVLYRYGEPYIIIKNILDDEQEEDELNKVQFNGAIPSIKDFYYKTPALDSVEFNLNLKYEKKSEKESKKECLNKLSLEKGRLFFTRYEDGVQQEFSDKTNEVDIIKKLKGKFNFLDIFFDTKAKKKEEAGKGPGRVIKLINPYEGKYIPPSSSGSNKDYYDLTDAKNLENRMIFHNNVVAIPGKKI